VHKFEDLDVWKLGKTICIDVELLFQKTQLGSNFKLRNQMEGSSGSIMDNIAEGFERGGNKEFHNFLSYSKGSAAELKSQLYCCINKELISKERFGHNSSQCDEVINRIGAFMAYLRKTDLKGIKYKKE
jgi:four helix bundle protein